MRSPEPVPTAALLLDFDGTAVSRDLTEGTFEGLARGEWRQEWRALVESGLGSRGVLGGVLQFLPQNRATLLRYALSEQLDPAVKPLIQAATEAGWAVEVLSDGIGLYIPPMLERAGIDVPTRCADVVERSGRLEMVTPWACGPEDGHGCGTCKVDAVRRHRAESRRVIIVGDGRSDRRAAAVADVVYATGFLARHCDAEGIAYRRWTHLSDVLVDLTLRRELPRAGGLAALSAGYANGAPGCT